jgi:hypothetical protein
MAAARRSIITVALFATLLPGCRGFGSPCGEGAATAARALLHRSLVHGPRRYGESPQRLRGCRRRVCRHDLGRGVVASGERQDALPGGSGEPGPTSPPDRAMERTSLGRSGPRPADTASALTVS